MINHTAATTLQPEKKILIRNFVSKIMKTLATDNIITMGNNNCKRMKCEREEIKHKEHVETPENKNDKVNYVKHTKHDDPKINLHRLNIHQ